MRPPAKLEPPPSQRWVASAVSLPLACFLMLSLVRGLLSWSSVAPVHQASPEQSSLKDSPSPSPRKSGGSPKHKGGNKGLGSGKKEKKVAVPSPVSESARWVSFECGQGKSVILATLSNANTSCWGLRRAVLFKLSYVIMNQSFFALCRVATKSERLSVLLSVLSYALCPLSTRSSKGSHSKKKGPRTPSPPPPVPLDIPVVGKKHKGKHKNKEKSEEKQKDGKDRGRDTEKHKEKKEKRRCGLDPSWADITPSRWLQKKTVSLCCMRSSFFKGPIWQFP